MMGMENLAKRIYGDWEWSDGSISVNIIRFQNTCRQSLNQSFQVKIRMRQNRNCIIFDWSSQNKTKYE